ncbi:MAG: CDP-alcohol phosphatidyltransferase family protein [Desulfatibacillaceae bacterium]
MSLRESFIAPHFYRLIEDYLLPGVERVLKTPNRVTLASLVPAALVPFGFFLHPFLGALMMGLSGTWDCLDGLMARRQGSTSLFGAFLDSSLDRVSDTLFLMGFWVLFWPTDHALWAGILVFLAAVATYMISYTKARAEGLGLRCDTGLFERGTRTLYLIIWALILCFTKPVFMEVLWSGLVLFTLLATATVVQRMVHVWRESL